MTRSLNGRPVITIGDVSRREFAESLGWLQQRTTLTTCDSTETGVAHLSDQQTAPALIVWLQSYPGEFGEADVAAARRVAPTAPMVCVYGTLSEGEWRTGRPLADMPRIPWYAWSARAPHCWNDTKDELAMDSDQSSAAPPINSRLESPTAARPHPTDRPGDQHLAAVVGVASAARDMRALIISACQTGGHVARPIDGDDRSIAPVAVAVWDDSPGPRQPALRVEDFARWVSPAPIIATISFPRFHDFQRLSQHGVKFMLGKPFMIEDLLWQIELLVRADNVGHHDPLRR